MENSKWNDLLEGECITEQRYRTIYFTDKCLFEPIQESEVSQMYKFDNEMYCDLKGIECALFYTQAELDNYLKNT